jgi:hypothetical protein
VVVSSYIAWVADTEVTMNMCTCLRQVLDVLGILLFMFVKVVGHTAMPSTNAYMMTCMPRKSTNLQNRKHFEQP